MRVCIVGHSLIHPRQYLFADELRRQGVEVMEVYPAKWGNQVRDGGYEIDPGSIIEHYKFLDKTYKDIFAFHPDIIYSMTEFWQVQAWRSKRWANALGAKLVYFFWENLRVPDERQRNKIISAADLIICGNSECQDIVRPSANRTVVLPQVGIDTDRFKPMATLGKHDIIFVGRHVPEKGYDIVLELTDSYDVLTPFDVSYEDMAVWYNKAKIQVVTSLDTQTWKEQWPACIGESLACNVPVIAFDSGSIRSNYGASPNVYFVNPGEYEVLKHSIQVALEGEITGGRDWVLENLSNEVIAKKLIEEFEKLW